MINYFIYSFIKLDLGKDKRTTISHSKSIPFHNIQIRAYINRSDCVTPGPPFRGILSPPETSITYIIKSAKSLLKLAARLSPPDSISNNSVLNFACSFSRAPKLAEKSSLIAACGHPPVSIAAILSAGSASFLVRNSPSSRVKISFVTT